MKKPVLLLCVSLIVILLLSGCLARDAMQPTSNVAGFFLGVWHGWMAPIALIVRLFNPAIRIYAVHNTGWWYEFGFYLAIVGGFGTLSLVRKKGDGHR
ncbi:hypothetical protein [Sphaerochaeta globosa]|uniref:Lipoprotein n=1 Tax=Sphaerochaeta globosa (strain ATCC BAA-1886 / DSM 22777 / Buddy) TaxID=158189 RepID=F0RZG3_SPHGB|nr:hypothetical protein [Sphaerochaeta globosa]ADY13515.1 hypothetical protein SpiBuddy_1690 [Sphaerochaeta globosa str. Buddy]